MKRVVFAAVLIAFAGASIAQTHHVNGYMRKDGTYVAPHTASNPNANRYDNRSSQSNGGTQRDEYSSAPATNKKHSGYGSYDNDNDGVSNSSDQNPEDNDDN